MKPMARLLTVGELHLQRRPGPAQGLGFFADRARDAACVYDMRAHVVAAQCVCLA